MFDFASQRKYGRRWKHCDSEPGRCRRRAGRWTGAAVQHGVAASLRAVSGQRIHMAAGAGWVTAAGHMTETLSAARVPQGHDIKVSFTYLWTPFLRQYYVNIAESGRKRLYRPGRRPRGGRCGHNGGILPPAAGPEQVVVHGPPGWPHCQRHGRKRDRGPVHL